MVAGGIKVIVFDVDDTLWYSVDDPRADRKYDVIDDRRVADSPGVAQELVENAREVLQVLVANGYTLAFGTMGPEEQVRAFATAFGIDRYFSFEISAFDRVDKAEKIATVIARAGVEPGEVMFVDDNTGYLAAANARFPGVKCVWAHYRMSPGLLALADDVEEMHGFRPW